jgi:hypothetical protein
MFKMIINKCCRNSYKLLPIVLSFIILPAGNKIFAQSFSTQRLAQIFDSVKTIYGNPCTIGVPSNLITELAKYGANDPTVQNYLAEYDSVDNIILNFRNSILNTINNQEAVLFDVSGVFPDSLEKNLINLCGIYYGPEYVSSLIVSYTIIHDGITNFYLTGAQFGSFDKTFKNELINSGKDWFYSQKLKQIKNVPFQGN